MFADVMPLLNHGSYILIKFIRLIGENAVLIFSEMKRLLSNLFSVDERMVFLDSYVYDSLSYIVAKRITGRVCNDRLCLSQYGCFCNT